MNSEDKLPTPYDLMPAPQLAIISVLERTLEILVRSLLAEHPDLFDHEKPYWLKTDLVCRKAKKLLSDIDVLSRTLLAYRHMLSAGIQSNDTPDDTSPF
jgi:hypothetical protein